MHVSALATDLYQLTMLAGYDAAGLAGRATFELYVRQLPPTRAYLVAAGLEQAVEYLTALRFTEAELAWLREVPNLRGAPDRFFSETLARLRFTGDLWAMPEGMPFFAGEPVLRVTAPLLESQLVETALLSIVNFQTSVASKAARVLHAAAGRDVMEFGARRAHGIEAGVLAARAAILAGCSSTSNVEAGFRFRVPLAGTMSHSWVTAFGSEIEAFERYAAVFGSRAVFLIDTYDPVAAARAIVAAGLKPAAVRLDSGDLVSLSKQVRQVLDAGGLTSTRIVASGDLDEWIIAEVVAAGAPIDAFGVGTALVTSKDAPALGGIYKLVEIERDGVATGVMKLSAGGKSTLPGRKQVWRCVRDGVAWSDVVGLATEVPPVCARPLLVPIIRNGVRVADPEPLDPIRVRHRALLAEIPEEVRALEPRASFPVTQSQALAELAQRTAADVAPGDGQL